jgi:PadR family transcriptional regulator, regulatory protein PadR
MIKERISGELLKGHIAILVLSIVREKPSHGYEIMKTLSETTEGVFELGQGTIYPLLYSLEEQHLIRSKTGIVDGRKRRVYYLTAAGRKAQNKQNTQWQLFQEAMNKVLKLKF